MCEGIAKDVVKQQDARERIREALERELFAEARASDRPADAEGAQMHTLIPALPIRR